MRGTARRHEGDADDVEWRDERWTEGRDEGDVSEFATGFQWSCAPDSPIEPCSSGSTVGSHVGRVRTMTGRDEVDADDAEWRDERSNRREGERKVTQWRRSRQHECDDNERKMGNEP